MRQRLTSAAESLGRCGTTRSPLPEWCPSPLAEKFPFLPRPEVVAKTPAISIPVAADAFRHSGFSGAGAAVLDRCFRSRTRAALKESSCYPVDRFHMIAEKRRQFRAEKMAQAARTVLHGSLAAAFEFGKKLRMLGDVAGKDRHAGGLHKLLLAAEMRPRLSLDLLKQIGQGRVARAAYFVQQRFKMGVILVHEGNAECNNGHEHKRKHLFRKRRSYY
jgi:hypothetical protein